MDFKTVLNLLLGDFHKENVRYALAGGFALGLLGVPRATVDLDFVVLSDDLEKVSAIMEKYDYDCVYKSENVSQYVSSLKLFGEIDFIHAAREISKGMLKRARTVDIFEGKLKIKVLNPEDIIGLKLQAAANNPDRGSKEYLDIDSLLAYYKAKMDWELLETYFSMFGEKEKFFDFKAKYGKVK